MGQYYHGVILKKDFSKSYKTKKCEVNLSTYVFDEGAKLLEHSYFGNVYVSVYEHFLANKFYGFPFVWCGDYADDIRNYLEETPIDDDKEFIPYDFKGEIESVETIPDGKNYKYIINLSKKQFVDLEKCKLNSDIHPLPLLCSSGNGRANGDYFSPIDAKKVGMWAYDCIGIGDSVPEGFEELIVSFSEDY